MKPKYLYLVISLVLFGTACKKFVDVAPPYTSVSTSAVFSNAQTATAAQLGVYSTLSNYTPFNVARRLGAYTDELTNYDINSPFSRPCYLDALNPQLNISSWSEFYKLIYQANSVIENLQGAVVVPDSVRRQIIGEAKFSRAFFNFYLVNIFGDVPMPLTTDYRKNGLLAKSSKATVYTQILNDLKSADSSLNVNYVNSTTTGISTDRIRPNKWAAEAMLARTYLYLGDYVNAKKFSGAVIANASLYSLSANVNSVFSINNSEAIWQLQNQTNNSFVQEGYNFILQFYINTYGENQSSSISPQLLSAFENGDLRKKNWLGTYTDPRGTVYYYPYKYKQGYNTSPTEAETVLRLAEQYLISAEAKANTGDIAGAINDLNTIRKRAGLANYSGSNDKQSIITAILHERQVEFFCEWGHRFFDLKRSGTIDATMNIVAAQKGGSWASYKAVWPIPFADINKNPNLTQNSGY